MNSVKQFLSRRRLYSDLSQEIQEHIGEKIDELVASGMSRKEATHAARRDFGNATQIEERGREVWQWPSIENYHWIPSDHFQVSGIDLDHSQMFELRMVRDDL